MKLQVKSKVEYFKKVLKTFEELKIKFDIGRNTSQLISDLLSMDFFNNYLNKNKQFTSKDIQLLKAGTAHRTHLINTQKILFSIITNTISVIDKTINYANLDKIENNSKLFDQINSIIIFFNDSCFSYDVLASFLKISDFEELFINNDESISQTKDNASDLYKSYFSAMSLEHIQEHIHYDRPPDIKRRYLTILFVDIVGFSTMSEYADPSKIMEMLNFFFNEVNHSVKVNNGDIDKFIGDAMLVTFEKAEDAVRCAINIHLKDLEVINSKLEYMRIPEIKVHLGMHTDWIVQGDVGSDFRRETTVIGDGVNIAARVQGMSPPNEIWLTANTVASLGILKSEMKFIGSQKVKGRTQEVQVYKHLSKVRGYISVLIFEPDKQMQDIVTKQLQNNGINKSSTAINREELRNKLLDKDVGVLVLGPSINPSHISDIIDEVVRIKQRNIPIIPITRKDLDANNLNVFEKHGLKISVSLEKENGMQKVNKAVANEEVKYIPKLKEQPPPDQVKQTVEKGISTEPTEEEIKAIEKVSESIIDIKPSETRAEPITPPEKKVEKPVEQPVEKPKVKTQAEKDEMLKKEIKRKTTLSITGNKLTIVAKDIISLEGFSQLKKDITYLLQYSAQKDISTFIINLEPLKEDKISEGLVVNFLKMFDFMPNLKQVKVKVELPNSQAISQWENMKEQFQYQFIS